MANSSGSLRRALTLPDLVLFNIVAVLGLRWLSTSAAAGPSSLTLWVLAAVLFFIPQGLAVADLASRFPSAGGVYDWTKQAYGEFNGFVCGWCYWVNNLLYYPSLLLSAAVIATFAIGAQDSGLSDRWPYVLGFTLIGLWLAVVLNIVGVSTGRWLQNLGGIGSYLPGLALVALGVVAVFTRAPANALDLAALTPDLANFRSLNLWASIAFAFAGLELSGSLGEETRNPERTIARSILISAVLIAFLYIAGTGSVLWLVPHEKINVISGFFQAITAGAVGFAWLVPPLAALYVLGNLGGVGAWLTGPARIAFTIGLDKHFPVAFSRIHPRWNTPYVAIIVQATIATLFLILSVLGKGTTVEHAYLILLDTMLLVYFIPYVYLFLTFLRLRSGSRFPLLRGPVGLIVGASGLALTLLAMGLATIPSPGTESVLGFELKVVGGALAAVLAGGIFYLRGPRR